MSSIDFHDMYRAAKKIAKQYEARKSSSCSNIQSNIVNNILVRAITKIQTLLLQKEFLNPNSYTYLNQEFEQFFDWYQVGGRQVALSSGTYHFLYLER